jgi:hypothetical protein
VLSAANERSVLTRFLVHLLRDRPPIVLGDGKVVKREARFRAEHRKDRKSRLQALRKKMKKGLLSNDDRQLLDGLEGSSVYSSGYASVFRQKPAGKRAGNIPETKRLYVAKLVYEKLCPDRNSNEFLESQTDYDKAKPRALEMRLRQFEREHIAAGEATLFQLVVSLFSTFKGSEIARRYPALYQGFPRSRIPPNIRKVTDLMRITESEIQLLRSVCRSDR